MNPYTLLLIALAIFAYSAECNDFTVGWISGMATASVIWTVMINALTRQLKKELDRHE